MFVMARRRPSAESIAARQEGAAIGADGCHVCARAAHGRRVRDGRAGPCGPRGDSCTAHRRPRSRARALPLTTSTAHGTSNGGPSQVLVCDPPQAWCGVRDRHVARQPATRFGRTLHAALLRPVGLKRKHCFMGDVQRGVVRLRPGVAVWSTVGLGRRGHDGSPSSRPARRRPCLCCGSCRSCGRLARTGLQAGNAPTSSLETTGRFPRTPTAFLFLLFLRRITAASVTPRRGVNAGDEGRRLPRRCPAACHPTSAVSEGSA
jgi:hypothetical protein